MPLYPYGRRRTLVRELIPDQVWSFEQLQGLLYVAVPIRMTVLRLAGGLLLYGALPPTRELRRALEQLEQRYGPVLSIVLPTSSGLEHKLPLPALARAFPAAQVWISPRQWSFPLRLPLGWLGFPRARTRVLLEQGVPFPQELDWVALGPLDLGLGTFMEVACLHRSSGSLLVTDALVAIGPEPPALFEADPTPLLFHARDRGDEPLHDSAERRQRGWQRLVLFASYLRPERLQVPGLLEQLRYSMAPGLRRAQAYFGLYPFQWLPGWQEEFASLVPSGGLQLQVAPGAGAAGVSPLPAGPAGLDPPPGRPGGGAPGDPGPLRGAGALRLRSCLEALAAALEARPWAPAESSWKFLASVDAALLRWGVVPEKPGC